MQLEFAAKGTFEGESFGRVLSEKITAGLVNRDVKDDSFRPNGRANREDLLSMIGVETIGNSKQCSELDDVLVMFW